MADRSGPESLKTSRTSRDLNSNFLGGRPLRAFSVALLPRTLPWANTGRALALHFHRYLQTDSRRDVGASSSLILLRLRIRKQRTLEWNDGHTQRYGLAYVDFRDRKRTVKDSGQWYGKVAASNRLDRFS
jgi:glycosyl hydrolase family 1